MQISELAAQTGVSVHALRHYEKLGMLQPARRASGYREYTEAMRREVVFIAMSRTIGFSLKAIALQLPAYRAGRLTFRQMIEAMQARVAEIDAEINKLTIQRRAGLDHIAWMRRQRRAHEAKKAARLSAAPGSKAPWPVARSRRTPATAAPAPTSSRPSPKAKP